MVVRSRAADALALVPAAALPFIFLHGRYQPILHGSYHPGSITGGSVNVLASDVAIALVVIAALVAGARFGWRPLTSAWRLWLVAAALLLLFVVACFWRPLEQTRAHLVTATKLIEYALLAPSLVLLLRRRTQATWFLWAFVAWGTAASAWGVLQFVGAVDEFRGHNPGQLEPSFLGNVDFAATSGGMLAIGFAGLALGSRSRVYPVAIASGVVGVALAAQVLTYGGVVLMAIACVLLGRRARTLGRERLAAIVVCTALAGAGVFALRTYDTGNFLRFLGIRPATESSTQDVQTGAQRAALVYIGLRIWLDHPWLGVGFERSRDRYQPYLADAKRKFPQAESAFPSPQHRWGVQMLWVQLLADTGILGLVLGVATFATGIVLALKARATAALAGAVALGWILVAIGAWTSIGIVGGVPLDALTWLGFGLAAVAAGGLAE